MSRHYVISDLHLGMGRTESGDWHGLEDFKSDDAFARFLDHLDREDVEELIINGDWIDFPQLEPLVQLPAPHFSPNGHRLAWTEAESLTKLESCAAARAHKSFFDSLKAFLASGRRVTVLMGNHDPDLFWPRVQAQLYGILTPPEEDRLTFVRQAVRRGRAHVEHGNQQCSPENAFADPADLFHQSTSDGQSRLEMLWGTQFVCEYFNELELLYPFADNLKPEYRALWLGFKNRWVPYKYVAKFIKFLNGAGVPWKTLAEGVLGARRPDDLIVGVGDAELMAVLLERYAIDPEFQAAFDEEIKETSDEEWQAIASSDIKDGFTLDELEAGRDPGETLGLFRKALEFRAAEEVLKQDGVEFVIFGHTHTAIDGADDDAVIRNYFNTGTWTNSLDLKDPKVAERVPNLSLEDLRDDTLFDLRLNYVRIEVDGEQTAVTLGEFI